MAGIGHNQTDHCSGSTSGMGQKRKCPGSRGTSVLPSGADIFSPPRHDRFVPISDIAAVI